jgi:hypothetical protein
VSMRLLQHVTDVRVTCSARAAPRISIHDASRLQSRRPRVRFAFSVTRERNMLAVTQCHKRSTRVDKLY